MLNPHLWPTTPQEIKYKEYLVKYITFLLHPVTLRTSSIKIFNIYDAGIDRSHFISYFSPRFTRWRNLGSSKLPSTKTFTMTVH